jgi:hypothetical protein
VGASSRSKILGALLLTRLMGLRKRRLAIAGLGLVDVGDGPELPVVVASLESLALDSLTLGSPVLW